MPPPQSGASLDAAESPPTYTESQQMRNLNIERARQARQNRMERVYQEAKDARRLRKDMFDYIVERGTSSHPECNNCRDEGLECFRLPDWRGGDGHTPPKAIDCAHCILADSACYFDVGTSNDFDPVDSSGLMALEPIATPPTSHNYLKRSRALSSQPGTGAPPQKKQQFAREPHTISFEWNTPDVSDRRPDGGSETEKATDTEDDDEPHKESASQVVEVEAVVEAEDIPLDTEKVDRFEETLADIGLDREALATPEDARGYREAISKAHRRRRNGHQPACERCRLSKQRCGHEQPVCSRCVNRGAGDSCVYHPAPMTQDYDPNADGDVDEADGVLAEEPSPVRVSADVDDAPVGSDPALVTTRIRPPNMRLQIAVLRKEAAFLRQELAKK